MEFTCIYSEANLAIFRPKLLRPMAKIKCLHKGSAGRILVPEQ